MHSKFPIQNYMPYHNIQRGVVPMGNPSFEAPKFQWTCRLVWRTLMELGPLHVTLFHYLPYVSSNFYPKLISGFQDCFSLPVKNLNNFASVLNKEHRFKFILFVVLLIILGSFFFWGGRLVVDFAFKTILSNGSITTVGDNTVGYWFSVEIS